VSVGLAYCLLVFLVSDNVVRNPDFEIRRSVLMFIPKKGSTKKQISLYMPLQDYLVLRKEAARIGISISQLCLECMDQKIKKLKFYEEDN